MKKHNGIISFWKFMFTLCIMFLHTGHFPKLPGQALFPNGHIAVEFFFIVSGFLMARSAFTKPDDESLPKDTWNFIFKKIKNIFPYFLFSFIILGAISILTDSHSIYGWTTTLWELLLLRMVGFKMERLNSVAWYISAMIIGMAIIYPLLKKYKKNYSQLVAPILAILIAGYMSREFGNLKTTLTWTGFVYTGTLRAFMDLNFGILAYELCNKLKTLNFTKFGGGILTLIEILFFSFVVLEAQFLENTYSMDYIYTLMLIIAITIAFSEKTLTYNFACNKFFYYLEKLSIPMYFNQMFFIYSINYFKVFATFNYYEKVIIFIIADLILGIITLYIVKYAKILIDHIITFFKRKMIA